MDKKYFVDVPREYYIDPHNIHSSNDKENLLLKSNTIKYYILWFSHIFK